MENKIEYTIKGHVMLGNGYTYEEARENLNEAKQRLNDFGYVESFEIQHGDIVIPGKKEKL